MRSELMRHWVDAEVVRLLQLRSGVLRARGSSGAEASLGKLAVSTTGRRLAEWAPALLGPAGTLLEEGYAPPGRRRGTGSVVPACIASPGLAIAGGTDQIQRNIIGERVLGLPPEPAADRTRAP
jgi:alkylation response protein AidB-like acyl-CoA dehydrogenase